MSCAAFDVERMRELYGGEGLTTQAIANMFGCSKKTISTRLKKAGVTLRNNKWSKVPRVKTFSEYNLRLWYCNRHMSAQEIGNANGVGRGTVFKYLKKYSIPIRNHKLSARMGNRHGGWRGIGDVSGSYLSSIKRTAKRKRLTYSLDDKYLDELWKRQDGLCAYSGIKLSISIHSNGTASLDRIDSNIGYVEGNVQWIHKDINQMKSNLPEQTFVNWCLAISEHHKNRSIQTEVKACCQKSCA